jgi:hypothetical protein
VTGHENGSGDDGELRTDGNLWFVGKNVKRWWVRIPGIFWVPLQYGDRGGCEPFIRSYILVSLPDLMLDEHRWMAKVYIFPCFLSCLLIALHWEEKGENYNKLPTPVSLYRFLLQIHDAGTI